MVYDVKGGQLIFPDPILTGLSTGWADVQNQFIGSQLMPNLRVDKQAGKYYVFGREAWQAAFNGDLRAPGTMANETTGISLSDDAFYCDEHALELPVTPEEREMAAGHPIDPDRDAAELIMAKLMLGKELAIRDHVSDAANYPADHKVTLAGTSQWNDYANSDPVDDVDVAQLKLHSKIFRRANTMVIPFEVMTKLRNHPKVLSRIAYSQDKVATKQLIAEVFEVDKILVPDAGFIATSNSADVGAGNAAYIWGKNVWLGYVSPRPAAKQITFGYTFYNPVNGSEWSTDRRDDKAHIARIVRTRGRYDTKTVSKDENGLSYAGYLIQNVVA